MNHESSYTILGAYVEMPKGFFPHTWVNWRLHLLAVKRRPHVERMDGQMEHRAEQEREERIEAQGNVLLSLEVNV